MFRRIEDMDGGPGEPRSFGEWRKHHGGNFLAILIVLAVIIVTGYIAGGVLQALG